MTNPKEPKFDVKDKVWVIIFDFDKWQISCRSIITKITPHSKGGWTYWIHSAFVVKVENMFEFWYDAMIECEARNEKLGNKNDLP